MEIDSRRSGARAILNRRNHALGEGGRRPAPAARAPINHRMMFDDREARLGQIEHLPLLDPRDHRRRQPGEAMATRLGLAPLDDIGLCGRLQCAAGMSRLPAARLARPAAQAAGDARRLLQPVARRRLAAVRAVLVQLTPKLRRLLAQSRVLHPQNFNLAPKRRNQVPNLGSKNHPYLDSYFSYPCLGKSDASIHFPEHRCPSDSPSLGVTTSLGLARSWQGKRRGRCETRPVVCVGGSLSFARVAGRSWE